MEFKARRLLWLTLAVLMCGEALGAEQRCFLPTRGDGGRTMFIEPDSKVGFLAENDQELRDKSVQAWHDLESGKISRQECRDAALAFSWPQCIDTLLDNLKVHLWKGKSGK